MTVSVWHVFDPDTPDQTLAVVSFRPGISGETGAVAIQADSEDLRDFLTLFLEDPLNQRPVFIKGLGLLKGPHSNEVEQFDRAMSTLSHHFPGFGAEPASGE